MPPNVTIPPSPDAAASPPAAATKTVPSSSSPAPTATHSHTSGRVTASTTVVEFGKSSHSTGICFLDHMVDQLTSHGQLGVTMKVSVAADDGSVEHHRPHTDYAGGCLMEADRPHDEDIFVACGASLGQCLRELLRRREAPRSSAEVFLCPLDEALAEATLELDAEASPASPAWSCDLAPYGNMPPGIGRRWIGTYRCNLTPTFFAHLSREMGCSRLSLRKMRGHNAHHVVESAFKAFARVYRACLDALDAGDEDATTRRGCVAPGEDRLAARRAAGAGGIAAVDPEGHRTGSRSRSTKETTIEVGVDLDRVAPELEPSVDDAAAEASVFTGVELTDRILRDIRRFSGFHFDVNCDGDIYIDDHHTSEDVAITLGQCLNQALGSKAGLARMGCAESRVGGATIRCTIDLSNRPYFEWDLPLDEEYVGGDAEAFSAMRRGAASNPRKTGKDAATMLCGAALTCEMLQHVFESLTIEARATVHLELRTTPYEAGEGHTRDLALAAARAFGTALAECVRVDPRRAGKVASSKGTLSV